MPEQPTASFIGNPDDNTNGYRLDVTSYGCTSVIYDPSNFVTFSPAPSAGNPDTITFAVDTPNGRMGIRIDANGVRIGLLDGEASGAG